MFHHTYTHALRVLLDVFTFVAGELPKQLPVSLEVLNLGDRFTNTNTFTGGMPSEWGALTNLKELKMVACGLDGEICMPQHTCVVCFADISTIFCRQTAQGARQPRQFDRAPSEQQSVPRRVVRPSIHAFVRSADMFTFFAGELPKELGNLINLTVLYLSNNKFRGASYVPSYMRCRFADMFTCFAGELPKELGDLVNLTYFDAGNNKLQGESYAPADTRCVFC